MAEILLQPRVAWPRAVRVGGRHLVEVDFEPVAPWPFAVEELAVHVGLRTGPALRVRPLDQSVVLIHRFGGSYSPARFLLEGAEAATAAPLVLDLRGPSGRRLARLALGPVTVAADVEDGEQVTTVDLPEDSGLRELPGPVHILHLSNLLFTAERHWDEDGVLRALAVDLKQLREEQRGPDLICVTGDVTMSGQAQEFARAEEWVRECLVGILGVPTSQMFWVPGNHDENRREGKPEQFPQPRLVSNDPNSLAQAIRQHRPWTDRRRANWDAFQMGLRPELQNRARHSYLATRTIRGRRVQVLALDSSWLSGRDSDKGQLVLAAPKLQSYLDAARDSDLAVTLIHHPLDWLEQRQNAAVAAEINEATHLLLHGAGHTPSERVHQDVESRCLVVESGSLRAAEMAEIGYQLYRADPDRGVVDVELRHLRAGAFEAGARTPSIAVGSVLRPVVVRVAAGTPDLVVVAEGLWESRLHPGDRAVWGEAATPETSRTIDVPAIDVLPRLPRGRPVVLQLGAGTEAEPWELLLRRDDGSSVLARREGVGGRPWRLGRSAALVLGPTDETPLTTAAISLLEDSGRTVYHGPTEADVQVVVVDVGATTEDREAKDQGLQVGGLRMTAAELASQCQGADLVLLRLAGGKGTPWAELGPLGVALWNAGVGTAILGLGPEGRDDETFVRLLRAFLDTQTADAVARSAESLPGWWQWWGRAGERLMPEPLVVAGIVIDASTELAKQLPRHWGSRSEPRGDGSLLVAHDLGDIVVAGPNADLGALLPTIKTDVVVVTGVVSDISANEVPAGHLVHAEVASSKRWRALLDAFPDRRPPMVRRRLTSPRSAHTNQEIAVGGRDWLPVARALAHLDPLVVGLPEFSTIDQLARVVELALSASELALPDETVEEAVPPLSRSSVDLLIVTALRVEFEQVLAVESGAIDPEWRIEKNPYGQMTAFRHYSTEGRPDLLVATTLAGEMSGIATAALATRLISIYEPACLAISGICAGRRGEVALGDVVFADRIWSYDPGKSVVEDGVSVLWGDLHQFRLERRWKQRLQRFELPEGSWRDTRPLTYESQEHWLLQTLLDDEQPERHADRSARCPDWADVVMRLRQRGVLTKRGVRLTKEGREKAEATRLLQPDGQPLPGPVRFHIGPMATGSQVVADRGTFGRLAHSMRKVLALDMDASALGAVADVTDLPLIVAKGVADHADQGKDDRYRTFAARASAECLLAFIRAFPPEAKTKRPTAPETSTASQPAKPLTRDEVLAAVARGESLDGADLRGMDFAGEDLAGASLRNAKLDESLLVRANLSRADLTGASLPHADLKYADLSGANLEDADLDLSNLEGATLKGARIRKTTFPLKRVRMVDVMNSVQTGKRLSVMAPEDDDEEPI